MVGSDISYQLLLVDDDAGFRQTLKTVLNPYFETYEVASGEEAVEIVEAVQFDLFLLDMHMDVLTGIETWRIIRETNTVAPCILITGDATDELERDAIDADAFGVLKKPVRKAELFSAVSNAMLDAYDDNDFALRLA